MINEPVSFIKACQDFFSSGENGKKVEISEFKALTKEDRDELRDLLTQEGYELLPPSIVST